MRVIRQPNGDNLMTVSVSDMQKNFVKIVEQLKQGTFVELRKHNVKIGMIVPY